MSTPMLALWEDAIYLKNFRYRSELSEEESYPTFVSNHFRKRAAIADRFDQHLQNLLEREIVVEGEEVDVMKIKNEMKVLQSDFNMVLARVRGLMENPEEGELQNKGDTIRLDEMLLQCVTLIKWYTVQYFAQLE